MTPPTCSAHMPRGGRFLHEVELVKYRRGIDTRIEPHIYTAEELDSPYGPDIKQRGVRLA
ncbi:hypothetical protein HS125_17680 [bacterium]|nr:hypothetical protein [bacterium]